jgi:hypothetical protein
MRDPTTTTTTSHTPPHHPYTPSRIAVSHGAPKTEPQWLSFGFLAQTRSPHRVLRTRDPTTTTTSHTPPPHPYAPSCIAISHGTPETKPQRLGFGFLAQTRSLPCVSQTHDPITTTTLYAPPPHPYALSPIAISHGTPETEPRRLVFFFSPQIPLLLACRVIPTSQPLNPDVPHPKWTHTT